MRDAEKPKEQLARELDEMRTRVAKLEDSRREWQRTQEAFRGSEERFHKIFEHSNDGIFIVDPEHDEIIDANSKACDMLGYAREELLALSASAIHPREMPKFRAFAKQVAEKGKGWTNELTCLTKSSKNLATEMSAALIDLSGRTYMIALVRDITERKKAEAELRRANERMRADLEAAARIQKALLPGQAPPVEGIGLAWEVQPCEELAGDILNIFQLDKDCLGLYIVDVSGHGVQAAMLSVALHRVLTAVPGPTSLLTRRQDDEAKYEVVSPALVCTELNRLFPMDAGAVIPQYLTLIYGVLNTKTRQFRYALAGHPPPIYEPAEGKAFEIGQYGFPIGFFSDASYEEQIITAEPGSRLYFYSDGVTEIVNSDDESFGRDRLREAIDDSRGRSLHDALSYLLERVQAWSGDARREDDISLLAVEIQ